ncbi:UDP-glucose 4-epimerase [Corynebacterium matruchotii]|nr:UDP-glucose 4-epimerase [Corynebacterium matruchotii]
MLLTNHPRKAKTIMKLLVTGGAGYVGSVCATVLLEQGHDITIVDNFSTGNRDAVPANATLIEGDIRDVAGDVLAEGDFDGVVHFAARSLVGNPWNGPKTIGTITSSPHSRFSTPCAPMA